MKKLFILIIFCHVASSVKHSLTTFFTGSTGVPNLPQFVGVVMVNDTEVIYCDSNMDRAEPKQDWMKKLMKADPEQEDWYSEECRDQRSFFSSTVKSLMQHFNQTGGVHIFQNMYGCEWNTETDKIQSFYQFGYDGEDFMSSDSTDAEIPENIQSFIAKEKWDKDNGRTEKIMDHLNWICPQWLKKYVEFGRNSLLRRELPSVSLLQKTPSSPVSCHASGFYPNESTLFWRKEDKELHADHLVEMLPNHDGTFQLHVDFVPPVKPEDWRKYECVFKFDDKDDIVIKLDKEVIRTNWEEHSLMFFFTGFFGVKNFTEFVGVVMVDDTEVVYCDSNLDRAEPKQDWMKKLMEDDPEHMDWYTEECRLTHRFFNSTIEILSNQTGDVHTFQRIYGCEQDEEVDPVDEYGYDGHDFLQFNLTSKTWSASTEQAINIQPQWDQDKERIASFLTQRCPDYLKKYLLYGNNTLQRTELPSVSLLQKTSSSPVSCHATGFYPDGIRAKLIWRKDGKEIHENVDHGEILPNHDGTFQMSVDLDLSSVKSGDWRRYECVFHLSGVKDDIVTRLDKDMIRTNEEKPDYVLAVVVPVVVLVLVLIIAAVVGFMVYRKKKSDKRRSSPDTSIGSSHETESRALNDKLTTPNTVSG